MSVSIDLGGFSTISELARATGLSRTWIRRVLRENGIPMLSFPRTTLVAPEDVRRLKTILRKKRCARKPPG
jgi:hypothetical protein